MRKGGKSKMKIFLENVTKYYQSHKALHQVSLQIKGNTITGLIGRNGAGKTTLLKLIAGFVRETEGEIKVFDERPFDRLPISANSIFVDDRMRFPDTLTLEDILREGKRFYPNWDEKIAEGLFDYFHFDRKKFHRHLSKGKKSTFNFIFGLCTHASLTIFDEPTTGMDLATRKDVYRALLKDYLAHPRTIIISSHHLDEIEDILEDIILLDEGRLLVHTSIDDFRELAIGVFGDREKLQTWCANKEIIYQENVGIDDLYVVIKNKYKQEEIEENGFRVEPVASSDLAVYLTNLRGGIDDVFTS